MQHLLQNERGSKRHEIYQKNRKDIEPGGRAPEII